MNKTFLEKEIRIVTKELKENYNIRGVSGKNVNIKKDITGVYKQNLDISNVLLRNLDPFGLYKKIDMEVQISSNGSKHVFLIMEVKNNNNIKEGSNTKIIKKLL